MKIYIAGSITNDPNYKRRFVIAEYKIKGLGHTPLNPCKQLGFTYREYINMGLCELMHCDAIYLLKGWEHSGGACLEKHYAKVIGLEIFKEGKYEPHEEKT